MRYAGAGARKWRSLNWRGFEVLTVEILENRLQDVNLAATWTYLWRLASLGLVRAVVGGPPCQSGSRLSPRPLRGRDGLRYGLPGLSDSEQALADFDAALVLKQVGLWKRAWDMQSPGLPPPAFLLESPEDPACYLDWREAMNMPSFWNFPEMQSLVGLGGLGLAAFDQGALGHGRRKPTKVLTNLGAVLALHGLEGDGFEVLAEAGDERIDQSRTWALWAPQLRERIYEGLVVSLEGYEDAFTRRDVAVKRMSAEEWRHHLQRQHVPFHRDCRTCVREMGVDRPHRRLKEHPSVYSLNVDVLGPFLEGEDSGDYKKKVRYALLATIPVPILDAVEGVASSDEVLDPGDPVVMDCLDELPEKVDCAPLELVQEINAEALKGLDAASRPYKVQNLTFVEMMRPLMLSKH